MKTTMRLLITLLLAFSLPVFAQHENQGSHKSAAQSVTLTDGLVKKIDKAAGEVVIQHGRLDSIGMPAMTMSFGVANKAWLNKLKVGDKIRFAAEMKNDNPIVSRYEMAK
jgi:Cu/Ag efflux protein CusF